MTDPNLLFPAVVLVLLASSTVGCALLGGTRPATVEESRTTLRLGTARVDVVVHSGRGPGPVYINLHDDEQTSVDAALAVIAEYGGRVLELQHGGARNITFALGGIEYVIDPNRMFSDAGAAASLADLGPYSDAALRAVRAFASEVLNHLDLADQAVVVTLHNNTPGAYSAESYRPGGDYERDAASVIVHDGVDTDDFFFVTDRTIHEALGAAGFNSVLQDNEGATDDGSLSVYAAAHGLPYVNAEAEHGHLDEQVAMLLGLRDVLRALGLRAT